MENVVDAMKHLGLEGRVHLEWVSASEGPKFRETVTRVCRADQGAWTQVRFGTRRNRRKHESLGYSGRRQRSRRPVLVFSWYMHYTPRAHSTSCPHLQHDHVLDSKCASHPTDHIRVHLFLSASQWHANQDDVAVSPPTTQRRHRFCDRCCEWGCCHRHQYGYTVKLLQH
jgi:hypothetical protein